MYGDDWRYAESRLAGTYVRYKGELAYVAKVRREGAFIRPHEGADEIDMVKLSDLDVKPISLGYVNYRNNASYIVRMPKRRDWRQGARRSNIKSISGSSSVPFTAMARTVAGDFPPFKDCLKVIDPDQSKRVAFHRHWALDSRGRLHYRGRVVGKVESGEPMLEEGSSYLSEYLRECL